MGAVTAPATEDAVRWGGWGTALKPSHEPIVVARKTLAGTVAATVLEHGTGAINVDACRVPVIDAAYAHNAAGDRGHANNRTRQADFRLTAGSAHDLGRWPTNVVFSHSPDCDDTCAADCAVADLDRQSGTSRSSGGTGLPSGSQSQPAWHEWQPTATNAGGVGDVGGASRFFPVFRYEPKAPASERPCLADGTVHTTVKPLDLMRWLVRLVTPPNGVVLDPFAGSGTTLEACAVEGFRAIGIEKEQPYADLCRVRLSKPIQPVLGFEEAS
jgi:site-specific DNA-methyltransferase (adenine-specific)